MAATVLFTGCGTTAGYKQADKTGAGIAEFREEIVKGKTAIDNTMTALNQIAASANTDPRKAYEQYIKRLGDLNSAADRVKKRAQEVKEQGQAYFKQWEKQMAEVQNSEIRILAEQRKTKLQQTFDTIKQYTEPLKAEFDPWVSDLKDLQKYLSNDLTIAGVDAAKPLFAKIQGRRCRGTEVHGRLDRRAQHHRRRADPRKGGGDEVGRNGRGAPRQPHHGWRNTGSGAERRPVVARQEQPVREVPGGNEVNRCKSRKPVICEQRSRSKRRWEYESQGIREGIAQAPG